MKYKLAHIRLSTLCAFLLVSLVTLAGCDWFARDLNGQVFIVQQNGGSLKLGLVDVYTISEEELRAHLQKKATEGSSAKAKIEDRYRSSKAIIDKAKRDLKETKAKLVELEGQLEKGKASGEFKKKPEEEVMANFILQQARTTILPMLEAEAEKKISTEQKVVAEYESYDSPAFYFSSVPGLKAVGKTDADGKFSVRLPRGDLVLVANAQRKVLDTTENYFWAIRSSGIDFKRELFLSNDNLVETKCQSCVTITPK
jgi:hypothetical protein